MKMVKSLLLSSAAGLVAVAGAQAADLPVKAKPVEYVKICTLYGEGFYYIPGSDTCIKLGGYVRADYGWNVAGARTPAYSGTQGAQDRTVSQYSTRHRANIQMDTRTQTAYGTLRTFTSLHFQNEDNTFSSNTARAFIQWAGFTFGHAQSFQDTWGITDSWHFAQQQNNSDTGANGVNQIAYTWELGNGVTLTVGADEVRRKSLTNLSNTNVITVGAEPTSTFAGEQWPDAHIDLKVNQAWGYAALTGVVHNVNPTYYSNAAAVGFVPSVGCAAQSGTTLCGHPDDEIGWAIEYGAEVKLPQFGPQDRIGMGLRYAQGATGFGGGSNLSSGALFGNNNTLAVGSVTDGVYLNGGSIALTTSWTAMGGYEHSWTPTLKTSFTAGYSSIMYNDAAKAMFLVRQCTGQPQRVGNIAPAFCDPDSQFLQAGSRTMWTVVPGFFLGVDVFYTQEFTAFKGATATVTAASGARPTGTYVLDDNHTVGAVFRAQRNFNAGD
jgi:hypothetical protein